jgi:multicomponent Na+:H+ antiporter subunit D
MNAHLSLIPLFVIIPLGGAFLTSLIGRFSKRFSDFMGNIITLSLFVISFYAISMVNKFHVLVYEVGGWRPPFGISLVLDGLSSFMLLTVNLISLMITIFAINYMEKFTTKWKFYTLFLLMLAGMNGVIITGDIFNLFVFLEIASVASYALVAYGTEMDELEASFKYTVMSSVASIFVLLGIGLLYAYSGTLNMADLSHYLASTPTVPVVKFVMVLFLMGFGLKAAIVPFHAWLPDAHPSAPAPISAALSGVVIKALGIYCLVRIFFNVFEAGKEMLAIIAFLGVLSMMVGVLLAIGQWDFKRLLAYHSISQVGYIMLGIGLGTPLGILGGLFHLFNHSIFKSLLFLTSGSIEYTTGTRNLEEMGGLREKLPVTANTNFIASMSIAGIPPFNGFWSKLIIILACLQAGKLGYAFWAVLGSILTLSSFMKVQKYAFFGKLKEKYIHLKEVPSGMAIPMLILAIMCIVGGILIIPGIDKIFIQPAVDVITQGLRYKDIVMGALQ